MERGVERFPFFIQKQMINFSVLHQVLNKAQNVDPTFAWFKSVDRDTKELIIKLNTEDQLGVEGIDSDGSSLGSYRPFTVEFRMSKGLQVGHVDFKVTGEYWDSWKIRATEEGINIIVKEDRFNELVNQLNFSKEHVGLTDLNTRHLRNMIREKYRQYARKQLLR